MSATARGNLDDLEPKLTRQGYHVHSLSELLNVRPPEIKALSEFASRYPEAAEPLQRWRKLIERGSFESFAVFKQVFGSVDKVGDLLSLLLRFSTVA